MQPKPCEGILPLPKSTVGDFLGIPSYTQFRSTPGLIAPIGNKDAFDHTALLANTKPFAPVFQSTSNPRSTYSIPSKPPAKSAKAAVSSKLIKPAKAKPAESEAQRRQREEQNAEQQMLLQEDQDVGEADESGSLCSPGPCGF